MGEGGSGWVGGVVHSKRRVARWRLTVNRWRLVTASAPHFPLAPAAPNSTRHPPQPPTPPPNHSTPPPLSSRRSECPLRTTPSRNALRRLCRPRRSPHFRAHASAPTPPFANLPPMLFSSSRFAHLYFWHYSHRVEIKVNFLSNLKRKM